MAWACWGHLSGLIILPSLDQRQEDKYCPLYIITETTKATPNEYLGRWIRAHPNRGLPLFLFLGKKYCRTPFEHINIFFSWKKNISARSRFGLRLVWFPGKSGIQFTSQAHMCHIMSRCKSHSHGLLKPTPVLPCTKAKRSRVFIWCGLIDYSQVATAKHRAFFLPGPASQDACRVKTQGKSEALKLKPGWVWGGRHDHPLHWGGGGGRSVQPVIRVSTITKSKQQQTAEVLTSIVQGSLPNGVQEIDSQKVFNHGMWLCMSRSEWGLNKAN